MLALTHEILKSTGASSVLDVESVQTLWSGYGEIKRYFLAGSDIESVIVKHIQLPGASENPKGWNTQVSHQRKLKSYQIEKNWYQHFAHQTDVHCKVPRIFNTLEIAHELLLIMEDLNASGYDIRLRPETVSVDHVKHCLSWLAHFHAKFMNVNTEKLWRVGTYWHLTTRQDEWEKMKNAPLKQAAEAIDERLCHARFQTLVHGDAKLANFCFSKTHKIAAVDFQYVGKGCGMKDVAYLISSCFEETDCEHYEAALLSHYFDQVEKALDRDIDFQEVKQEWSHLYKYAWADFYRFLDGWSPGHWKLHGYSERLTQEAIEALKIEPGK